MAAEYTGRQRKPAVPSAPPEVDDLVLRRDTPPVPEETGPVTEKFSSSRRMVRTADAVKVVKGYKLYTVPNNDEGRGHASYYGVHLAKPGEGLVLNEEVCQATTDGYLAYRNELMGVISEHDAQQDQRERQESWRDRRKQYIGDGERASEKRTIIGVQR
jgi:hypothetical protein